MIDDAGCEQRLAELEQLQADLVSATAHRLRSPLTVLRAHAELLAGGELTEASRDSIFAIVSAARQLQNVSDDLVDLMRAHAGGAEHALKRWLDEAR